MKVPAVAASAQSVSAARTRFLAASFRSASMHWLMYTNVDSGRACQKDRPSAFSKSIESNMKMGAYCMGWVLAGTVTVTFKKEVLMRQYWGTLR